MTAPDRTKLLRMYELTSTMKQCDERLRAMIGGGQIMLFYYSPRGQECIAAALGVNLHPDDYLVANYRCLHDNIAKGVPLRELWAEFLGRSAGPCKGKGGPLHVTYRPAGVMVATGVVGSGTPIANGFALASQLRGDGRVTAVTFGDGASNIGAVHEAMNMASLWQLPVVFVCQNNAYAEMTAFAKHSRNERISDRAAGYAMPGTTVDGNDPIAIEAAVREAVERARQGGGPTLIEAKTYRFWGHYFGDAMTYMPPEERKAAMDADPVPRFRQWLIDQGHATEDELAALDRQAAVAIDDAVEFALASPPADLAELTTDVYGERVPV